VLPTAGIVGADARNGRIAGISMERQHSWLCSVRYGMDAAASLTRLPVIDDIIRFRRLADETLSRRRAVRGMAGLRRR
jgi:hypothetical protein